MNDKKIPEALIYNENAVRNNFSVLEFSRTCQSAAAGIASGILGLTGTYGFLVYFASVLLQVKSSTLIFLISRHSFGSINQALNGKTFFHNGQFSLHIPLLAAYSRIFYFGYLFMEWFMFISNSMF